MIEIDEKNGWPLTGYRCNGCRKSYGKYNTTNCLSFGCPVKRNVESLTPTITATQAAEIVGTSKAALAMHCKAGNIPGAYFSGCWQIPQGQINKEPMSSMPFPAGNPHK